MSGDVMQRLDRVEREKRWMKQGGMVAIAVIAAVEAIRKANTVGS